MYFIFTMSTHYNWHCFKLWVPAQEAKIAFTKPQSEYDRLLKSSSESKWKLGDYTEGVSPTRGNA